MPTTPRRPRPHATKDRTPLFHRSAAVGATVEPTARGFRLDLDEAAYGVAPGQTAVLYEDGAVVGAGIVSSSSYA